jgi:hypothetical protein
MDTPTPPLPDMLTPTDIADWLNQPATRIIRQAKRGQIPCVVLPSGDIAFIRTEVIQWLGTLRPEANRG